MSADTPGHKRKRHTGKIIAISLFIILFLAAYFIYNNFNRLVSEALIKSFDSNIVSDIYELKFEKLRINIFEGNVRVVNVVLQPRETPLRKYPYINSSFQLTTEKIILKNVRLMELLRSNKLIMDEISITKPEIQLMIASNNPVFLPFKDTTTVKSGEAPSTKTAINGFTLQEFELIDASFSVVNVAKQREFEIATFSITMNNLMISQQPGRDLLSFKQVVLSVDEFAGSLKKGSMRRMALKGFKMAIDSLSVQKTVDTLIFRFDDFKAGLNALDIHTADSLFHFTMQSFNFSYKDKSIKMGTLSFKPNISDAEMQKMFKYQHTQISGAAETVNLLGVNFDSLIYYRSLFIDSVTIDKPEVSIFKDNTKPVDSARFPKYFGQQIATIPLPLRIKQMTITHVNLVNVERKRDSTYAKVNLRRGTVSVRNITNLSKKAPLIIGANAYIEDKVHFNAQLDFSYKDPQFTMAGKLEKFSLPDLNPVLQAYTPAKINAGTADEITFSGTVNWTISSGTMKFLYHDLDVDLDLREKARWKSSLLAFAANSIVNSSNPGTSDLPPRIVQLHATRDMHKGFVNILIKSLLNGVKETMMMSKENRKTYQASKKKARKELKAK